MIFHWVNFDLIKVYFVNDRLSGNDYCHILNDNCTTLMHILQFCNKQNEFD